MVSAPSIADGTQSLTITDPANGAAVSLINMLTLGAGPNDMIRLTQSINPSVPVGGEAASAIRVAVTSADGSTPVGGATVQWSASNGATLTACKGASSCFVFSDESGKLETRVDVGAIGGSTITATLAPASYSPPKSVQATVSGTSSATDLAIFTPKVWVAKGTTVDVPLTARLLSNGIPVSGGTINFQVLLGSGVVTSPSVGTDATGYARSTLHVSNLSSDVQGSACVAPANNPCQTFYVVAVAPSSLRLENVSGSQQAIWVGQSFRPVSLRVTDSSTPANPVLGATVLVQGAMFLPSGEDENNEQNNGETSSSNHAMQVVLGSFQTTMVTDGNGIVSFMPSSGGLYRPLDVEVSASAGTTSLLQFEFQQLPAIMTGDEGASTGKARLPGVEGTSRIVRSEPSLVRE